VKETIVDEEYWEEENPLSAKKPAPVVK